MYFCFCVKQKKAKRRKSIWVLYAIAYSYSCYDHDCFHRCIMYMNVCVWFFFLQIVVYIFKNFFVFTSYHTLIWYPIGDICHAWDVCTDYMIWLFIFSVVFGVSATNLVRNSNIFLRGIHWFIEHGAHFLFQWYNDTLMIRTESFRMIGCFLYIYDTKYTYKYNAKKEDTNFPSQTVS